MNEGPWDRIVRESRSLLAIGAPLVVHNLCTLALQTIDTVMAGRLGAADLAAVAIGGNLWVPLFLFGMGVLMAVSPLAAYHLGAGQPEAIGGVVRQAAWTSAGVSAAAIAVLSLDAAVLHALGFEPAVIARADAFLDATAIGLPAAFLFQVLRFAAAATGNTLPIMVISAAAVPLNALLNWILIYGKLGAPAMGVVGCGWATTIVHVCMCGGLGLWMARGRGLRELAIFRAFERPRYREIGRQLRLGLPIGAGIFLEASLFGSAALMMGALGTAAVAAHQIALNYAALMFMVPLGISLAMTIRIGYALGAAQADRVRFIGNVGYGLCLAFAGISALCMLLYATPIVRLYTRDGAVLPIASGLLGMAALFQVSDGLQVAALGALRGLQDTRAPMLINAAAYWVVGFPTAYWLGIELGYGPRAVWAGLVLGLSVAAVLLLARFYRRSAAG